MKCIFQDCPLEATRITACKMGIAEQNVIVHVCEKHYKLLFNDSVSVSMEIKED